MFSFIFWLSVLALLLVVMKKMTKFPAAHECEECSHILPSQRERWHRGISKLPYISVGK